MHQPTPSLFEVHRARHDGGFTLIELLVVCAVLGLLAAIAIPSFLGQTRRGFDAQMKSSLRSLATGEDTFMASNQQYGTIAAVISDGSVIARATGVTLSVLFYDDANGYCLRATHQSTPDAWYWDSKAGGLQPAGSGGCPLVTTGTVGDSIP